MTFDPIRQDAPRNADYPASMSEFKFKSHGADLNGVIYHPSGEGLHGVIVLLHGFPGHERNFDLAQILRRAGWHVAVFHYRGAWGSGGEYRFQHVLEDTVTAIETLRSPEFSEKWRIDPNRIITIGHSLGGWASLMMGAWDVVPAVVSLAGVNMRVWSEMLIQHPEMAREALYSVMADNIAPLNGVTADDLVRELEANVDNFTWDIDVLSKKQVLMVGAKYDDVVPVFDHHMPALDALKGANAPYITNKLLATDHSFNDSRIALAETVLGWLQLLDI